MSSDYLENASGCSACGSLLCTRDKDCPTCAKCGKRGHITCYSTISEAPLSGSEAVWPMVADDLKKRDATGRQRYGDSLRASTLVDLLTYAYEKALDLCLYLRAELERRKRSP